MSNVNMNKRERKELDQWENREERKGSMWKWRAEHLRNVI